MKNWTINHSGSFISYVDKSRFYSLLVWKYEDGQYIKDDDKTLNIARSLYSLNSFLIYIQTLYKQFNASKKFGYRKVERKKEIIFAPKTEEVTKV